MKPPSLSQLRRLAGFGMSDPQDAFVFPIASPQELKSLLAEAKGASRQVTLRGSGLSYGDAATVREEWVAELRPMNQIVDWNPETGLLTAEAGATLDQIWRHTLKDGFWLPVVSGTAYPTLGGALAMNIHGKNAFRMGTLGEHATAIDVMKANGEIIKLTPNDPAWRHVIGGAGQFGAILRATIQMKQVPSPWLDVRACKAANLSEMFEIFERETQEKSYCVGWVDAFARGEALGRGVVHSASEADWPTNDRSWPEALPPRKLAGVIPADQAWRLLRLAQTKPVMRLINSIKAKVVPKEQFFQLLPEFHFLLDALPGWQKSYLPGGLIQFQAFVDWDAALSTFRRLLTLCQEASLQPNLVVLKKHRSSPFANDYAGDGYSLAMDFAITHQNEEELNKLLRRLTKEVIDAKGRFYWAKDSHLLPEEIGMFLAPTYLHEIRQLKQEWDPDGIWTSSMAKRLRWFEESPQ